MYGRNFGRMGCPHFRDGVMFVPFWLQVTITPFPSDAVPVFVDLLVASMSSIA